MILHRRRFLLVTATACLAGLSASAAGRPFAGSHVAWRGVALGAEAEIFIDGPSDLAERTVAEIKSEIARLERIFSLNLAESEISRLNSDGRLSDPDPDFLALLSMANAINEATAGAFDPTIQPIWMVMARRHAGLPTRQSKRQTGWHRVRYSQEEISFSSPGMAITLNGIAQGYITDKIAALLTRRGYEHLLVNIGEIKGTGPRNDGTPWPVRLKDPGGDLREEIVYLDKQALAVTHTKGTVFDEAGQFGHIIVPETGQPIMKSRLIAVKSPSAAIADGLSTGLAAMGGRSALSPLSSFPGTSVTCDTKNETET